MSNICVLDPHIADLIAAGEVVERPASVAKELMENAIDAGATQVTVELANGGMTFLRVTDNGRGIPAGELATAFLRHATSKLRTEYDLEAIATLGFRGEALAAIAAVSRIEALSRTADSSLGATLRLEGGVAGAVEEAGCPLGTTLVVRDLFFNTPARLKFMKKDAAEGAAVFAVVQRVALSHPEVSVKFIRDGKQELLTPGDGQLETAVYAVLGRELALGFRPLHSGADEISVTGFVSLPACCRGSRVWQFFFVNGRQVKSPLMTAAVEQAYENQKMVGKFPGCVLHLTTKLSAVDVNVHPAKTEVKFGAERQVFSSIYHAVLSALEGDRTHPAVVLAQPKPQNTVTPNQVKLTVPPSVRAQDSTYRPPAPVAVPATSAPATAPRPVAQRPVLVEPPRHTTTQPQHQTGAAPVQPPMPMAQQPVSSATKDTPVQHAATAPQPQQVAPPPQEQPWRLAGEVLNTYIIVEQGDRVFFIDKHAAHERLNFDRMKSQGYDPMAQTLLAPLICQLGVQEQQALLAHQTLLEEFGFEVDQLGSSLAVRQAPFDVAVGEIEETLTQLAQKLLLGAGADPAAARDELLHTMACKAAIKGGWKTSTQELERVARAVMEGQVKYCPHGRPVAIELTRKELEKQFRRA